MTARRPCLTLVYGVFPAPIYTTPRPRLFHVRFCVLLNDEALPHRSKNGRVNELYNNSNNSTTAGKRGSATQSCLFQQ